MTDQTRRHFSGLGQEASPCLSICIATYSRAGLIGQTLDSIIGQLPRNVELLVVDGASPDDTMAAVVSRTNLVPQLRYIREDVNSGVDADYDKAVGYARGNYCWLMTDDDVLEPGAVDRVLQALAHGPELVVVNARTCDADLNKMLNERLIDIHEDRIFNNDTPSVFALTAGYLSFIGGVVVRRDLWMRRERKRYYGSLFIHLGVLFQAPLDGRVEVIAKPLISIRYGNAMWSARGFEIWMFKWPDLIWGFDVVSDDVKLGVVRREPWRSPRQLLFGRAIGSYGLAEYRRFIPAGHSPAMRLLASAIAVTPGRFVNALCGIYCLLRKPNNPATTFDLARSRFATAPSRWANVARQAA